MRSIIIFLLAFYTIGSTYSQTRKIINIPDIPGFQTLKCDFHMHTVFSDGTVWPTVRVEEAWREGLDAISITDHIEYRPHSKDIEADHNRPYQIAEPLAGNLNLLLIQGAEITRSMPPGHFNTLFIKNANLLERENVLDALKEARDQGAFIIWNHPGWKAQQPDTMLWWNEHTHIHNSNMMHGIEVYNYNESYPEALNWAINKKLTPIAATDIHEPVSLAYDVENGHRPMTLVFSRTKTVEGIREALFSRRTIAWFDNILMGRPQLLEPLFFASVKIAHAPGVLRNGEFRRIELINTSDIDYELELVQPGVGFDVTPAVNLKANKASVIEISGNSDEVAEMEQLNIYFRVKNMFTNASENLIITFSISNQ